MLNIPQHVLLKTYVEKYVISKC